MKMSNYFIHSSSFIDDDVTIGNNTKIWCFCHIQSHAVIDAGAVVTSDMPDHALMLVVPARVSRWVCECGSILNDVLECKCCARKCDFVNNVSTKSREVKTLNYFTVLSERRAA